MHIPDGYLGPATYAALDAAIVPIWALAGSRVKRTLRAKQIPLVALGAAFSFVLMMFNVPVLGGSTGHAVGATLVAIVLGPWAAVISLSIAVVVQAVVFGDGGITALGANVLNMAVIMPFVGYYLFRWIAGDGPSPRRRIVAAGVAAYASIVVGAIATGVEFGLQPLLAHTASGQPLYAPYPLAVAVPAMALEHLLFFGPLEAVVTAGIVAVLARQDPALLEMKPAARPLRWLVAGLAALVLLTPLGALAPGTAWGEWSAAQLRASFGSVPVGLARLASVWTAAVPGYAPAFVHDPLVGYAVAAVLGAGIVAGVAWLLGRLLARSENPGGRVPRSFARRTADAVSAAIGDVFRSETVARSEGLLQSLDPRTKLASILLVAVAASFIHSTVLLAALIVLTTLVASRSGLRTGVFLRRVAGSAGIFAVLLAAPAATSLIVPGRALLDLGAFTLTAPGLEIAVRLIARVIAGAGFGLLVVMTTRYSDLLRALSALRVPDLVIASLAMTQQQIVSLLRTVENLHLARESRMLSTGSARGNRSWVVERMAFVTQRSMRTADAVYDAMLSRGFDGRMPALAELKFDRLDAFWLAGSALVCAAVLLADKVVLPL